MSGSSTRRQVRFAVMGAGRFGAAMIPRLNTAPACEVVAVASRDRSKAERLCHPLRLPRGAGCTYDELLAHTDVDAVYLAVPNHMHVEWAIRLLESGKNVLCEKPLSWNRAGARRAFMTAERCGLVLAEGFMYLHHPQTETLRRFVERGLSAEGDQVIGTLTHIASHRNFPLRDESKPTRLSHAMQGGALMDLGCYPLSFPVAVSGYALTDLRVAGSLAEPLEGEVLGVDEAASWTARLDGAAVTVAGSCSISEQGSSAIELVGHKGTLSTNWAWSPDEGDHILRFHPSDGGDEQRITLEEQADRARAQFASFARACRGDHASRPTPTFSLHVAELLESALRQVGVAFDDA